MALKVKNYKLPDESYLEEAYLKVQTLGVTNSDYEFFENTDNIEETGIEQVLKWIKRIESHATVFVWADELARKNNAHPMHWFKIQFDYDLSLHENIFEQAYKKLNILFPNSEGC